MRNGRAGAWEFTVRLEDPNELFEPRAADVERGRAPEAPAIEAIRYSFGAQRRQEPGTLTIELPPDKATPDVERGVRQAFVRYCEAGIASAERELGAISRDGWQTLLSGAVVLFIGLILSESVLRSKVPKEFRDFLGNGVFLVVAWVGLWYPLDTLFYAGRPHRADRKLLAALSEVEVVVRPTGGDGGHVEAAEAAAAARPVAGQSLTGG
jgi:hypothetical protein